MALPESLYADTILVNGAVITVDDAHPTAEAVALKGDRILHVGTNEEVRQCAGRATRVIDVGGKTVLPGFIEPHTHFMSFGIRLGMVNVRTPPNNSIEDVLARIRERAAVTPNGQWIEAQGYEHTAIAEKRWPTRAELDAAAPDNPLVITYRSSHVWMVNSAALKLAGIDDGTPQPEGGHMDRDPRTGKLTGVLREKAASRPITSLVPHPTLQELKDGVELAGREYNSVGITSTHDAGTGDTPDYYRAYQETIDEGRLKVRVYLMIHDLPYKRFYLERDLGLRTGFGSDWLRLGAVKTCSDGSIQVHTCAFYDPYITSDTDDPTKDPRGVLQFSPEGQKKLVLEAHGKGYQVAIHAQGDRGVDVALDAVENAMTRVPRPNPRHRIEHCQGVTREALQRMSRLGSHRVVLSPPSLVLGRPPRRRLPGHGTGAAAGPHAHRHRSGRGYRGPFGHAHCAAQGSAVRHRSALRHLVRGQPQDPGRRGAGGRRAHHPHGGPTRLHHQCRLRGLRGRHQGLHHGGQAGRPGGAGGQSPDGGPVGDTQHPGGADHRGGRGCLRGLTASYIKKSRAGVPARLS